MLGRGFHVPLYCAHQYIGNLWEASINRNCMQNREYAHVKETASPLAIAVESNGAGHDTSDDVNRDGEQVGGSSTKSQLNSGFSIDPKVEFVASADTLLMMVGRNNENA